MLGDDLSIVTVKAVFTVCRRFFSESPVLFVTGAPVRFPFRPGWQQIGVASDCNPESVTY